MSKEELIELGGKVVFAAPAITMGAVVGLVGFAAGLVALKIANTMFWLAVEMPWRMS